MPSAQLLMLVEDDDLDAMIVKRSLRELQIPYELLRKNNGEEAIDYLLACDSNLPCVILLDLNMPRMDGFEFLCYVKSHPRLREIPVLVLTTSTSELDIAKSLELGAARYVIKSLDIETFKDSLQCLQHLGDLAAKPLIHSSPHPSR